MSCVILTTDVFDEWILGLTEGERARVRAVALMLEDQGVVLRHPYSSAVFGSRHGHMRELRIQYRGQPFRILYAFDPKRNAVLLLGGNKGGDDRWYESNIPMADKLYDRHLEYLKTARE